MIIEFSKKYSVDIGSFEFAKYFYSEPSIFQISGTKPLLTIGHLEKAIAAGQLNEELVNN